MKEALVIKSGKFLEELVELRKINKLLTGEYQHNVNVKFHQHYGDTKEYDEVHIDKRHTQKFIKLLYDIISEVEQELDKL